MPPPPVPVEDLLRHTGFVRSLARGALGRDDGSEDVVQDAWVSALEHGPRSKEAAKSWLFRVVRNRVTSLGRREHARRRWLGRVAAGAPVPSPAEILLREEARQRLVQALLALDAMYREPLVLRYYEDLDTAEIGRRLGIPRETVKTRLRRAIGKLRVLLDERYESRRAWVLALHPLGRLPRGGSAGPGALSRPVPGWAWAGPALAVVVGVGVLVVRAGAPSRVAASGDGASRIRIAEEARLVGHAPASPDEAGREAGCDAGALATQKEPARVCVVTVLDARGDPVSGASVRVVERRAEFSFDRDAVVGETDDDGRLSMPRTATPPAAQGAGASSFALEVTHPRDRLDLQDVAISPWRPDDATVVLPAGFAIDGAVVDTRGDPVPGATVALVSNGPVRRFTTDAAGRFQAAGLPPGHWRAQVSCAFVGEAAPAGACSLDTGTRAARIVLPVGRSIHVRILGIDPRLLASGGPPLHVAAFGRGGERAAYEGAFPLARDGTLWLYGVEADLEYALYWGPSGDGGAAYAPAVRLSDREAVLRVAHGGAVFVKVVRPPGPWPTVRARGRGFEVTGRWCGGDECVVIGLPEAEVSVEGEGRDERGQEVSGRVCARPGEEATLVLSTP